VNIVSLAVAAFAHIIARSPNKRFSFTSFEAWEPAIASLAYRLNIFESDIGNLPVEPMPW
jgi:hypothetical protein